ncbi:uncharacterized protein TNIN_289761 [Trichonephila inaurata madagascariensis]|uniref:Uncharacterized protein n=1 Tax=Trichonephila inaurata madagascariensis TaxID=2747483 RepID=A0A8X6MGK7_9ARAC|nr:uncharacterized protein TNIN_289761 [Trichonephila inaurata madagascariensis]
MNEQNQLLSGKQEKLTDEDMEVPQAIEKILVFKSEQVEMLSVDSDGIAQPIVVEEEKSLSNVPLISAEDETYEEKETPVDVIKDKAKGDVDPVILSKQQVDLHDEEIEEEKPKLPKRKLKKLSRMSVAKLQQKVNLKASSNILLIPQHWSFRCEYSQDKRERKTCLGTARFYQTNWCCEGATITTRKRESKDKESED